MFNKVSSILITNKERFLLYRKLWKKFSKKRQNQLKFLTFLMFINAISEMVSLGLVAPFLSVLLNQDILWDSEVFANLLNFFNVKKDTNLSLPLTVIFIASTLFTVLIRLLNLRVSTLLSQKIGGELSCKAFEITLKKPYENHINSNSSELIAAISNYIIQTVYGIDCVLLFLTSCLVALFLLITIFIIQPQLTFNVIFILGTTYLIIAFFVSKRLNKNGIFIANSNKNQIKIMQESLGGIRDIIINNKSDYYKNVFRKIDLPLRISLAENAFIGTFPKYVIEAVAMIGIALISISLIEKRTSAEILPYLGMLALAAQKILPAVQQIFKSWTGLETQNEFIKKLIVILDQPTYFEELNSAKKLSFKNFIEFRNVSFKYEKCNKDILKNINFRIYKGQKVAILGSTGSGKSTTVDILMGLLHPSSGEFLIDKKNIFENKLNLINEWRNNIAHVPQKIFFSDSSIAENIAFGEKKSTINYDMVRNVCKEAQIDNYINSLPLKYDTIIGEGGARLSGGQRQRLGIARALYSRKSFLVLDEATSALDVSTEKAVLSSICKLSNEFTIIFISHNQSIINFCDIVYQIEDGKLRVQS